VAVVIVSADATPHQIKLLRDSGAVDYLTKPFDVVRFLEVVEQDWRVAAGADSLPDAAPLPPPETSRGLDARALADLEVAIGEAGLADLLATFRDESAGLLRDLRAAAEADDSDAVRRIAHSLTGSAGIVGATRLVAVLAELQGQPETRNDHGSAESLIERAATELDQLVTALS